MRALACVLSILSLAVLAACGDDGGASAESGEKLANPPAVPWLDPEGEPPIAGSLAVNPADQSLWMATNTGLFRVDPASSEPKKVDGTLRTPEGSGRVSEALVVRFTGPNQMLASGHPPEDDIELPDALGLIRSGDAGKTWTSVSELGTADFHAIESSQGLLVGSQFGQSQILASRDQGKTWESRTSPSVLVDLEVNPGDRREWVATSAEGVYRSTDEGRTWRAIDTKPNSYLVWAAPDALYRLDPGGQLVVSTDRGRSWEQRGSTGGEPQAITADGVDKLYALLLDGTVKRSEDGGRTWSVLVAKPAA